MQSSAPAILSVNGLSFAFKASQPVLNKIHLQVPKGSIYGFLGPNGAGKTTTMRLLTGLLQQQGNHISFFNEPLTDQLPTLFHRVGTLIETPSLYLHLSGLDNLRVVARLRGVSEKMAEPALQWVGLQQATRRKAKHYSLGMKQRLAIAMALLTEPELLLLDEPVNGLDPAGMMEIRELMQELNRQKGITIFISSHLLHEVEKMCTHIGIIHKGVMRFEGTLKELSTFTDSIKQITITVADATQWLQRLQEQYPDARIIEHDKITLSINKKEESALINRNLILAGAEVYELKIQDGLENWFMEITNN